ncbi:sulfotransferase family protein [Nitzschia inconspicua]|uniref:Sulfotransferase family protein n=1 Tax=Nitzschia inconspicua TaxID=303405 RepID=A0A9K3KR19_9STRA|nr:sulfotransferase family protein [Nitzschia inconspicua]
MSLVHISSLMKSTLDAAFRSIRHRSLYRRLLRFLFALALVASVAGVFFVEKLHRQNHNHVSLLTDLPTIPPRNSTDRDDQLVVPLRDDATKLQAQRCVQAGYGGVYFKHFRKAGGTTLYNSFRDNQCLRRQMPIFASEFPFFNRDTFDVLNSTVFVTTLRHPIDRILSLYWFEGRWPRTCHKACENNKTKDDTNKVADLEEWIEAIHDQSNHTNLRYVRHNGCGQWVSVENYYTRILLGVDRARDEEQAKSTLHQRGFRNVTLTSRHLLKAKQILASFDVILIQEEMIQPSEKIKMFFEMTGYGDKPPRAFGVERKGYERAKYFVPPLNSTLDRLRQLNALDIELYDYAVRLSQKNFDKWQQRRNEDSLGGNETDFYAAANCKKPMARLPQPVANIAVGGDFCVGGRWSGRTWSDFWYFPGCIFHSREAESK